MGLVRTNPPQYTTGDQQNPSIAVQPDGSFVVAWQSFGFAAARRFTTTR